MSIKNKDLKVNMSRMKKRLIRRNSQWENAEPAGEIAKGSLGVCDGQS